MDVEQPQIPQPHHARSSCAHAAAKASWAACVIVLMLIGFGARAGAVVIAQSRPALATKMFETVLNSFLN